ncbi:MAG: hypothetical protein IPH22_13810 [Nitrosomonas sp.]|nr:hypothetical protein [Nitrosomonas sp.]
MPSLDANRISLQASDWYIHGRPRYAKLSVDDFEKVKIAAIHPDFM